MARDPVDTNPGNYRIVFENDRVRVLEYTDVPGHATTPHDHPDSVMITLSAFRRRITADGKSVDVDLPSGAARWLPAQSHSGFNTGQTSTHTLFVELKETAPASSSGPADHLGPLSS
ncbi:hypothetical protein [Arthrobacter sp. H20]|uniref:hypothetical protein n=1 Tax=Arthrobacter sp. H20 TaxID=1267981 RepID=UPI00047E6DE0|nr:hypothetical protein [Arthrobacter sp. H20]